MVRTLSKRVKTSVATCRPSNLDTSQGDGALGAHENASATSGAGASGTARNLANASEPSDDVDRALVQATIASPGSDASKRFALEARGNQWVFKTRIPALPAQGNQPEERFQAEAATRATVTDDATYQAELKTLKALKDQAANVKFLRAKVSNLKALMAQFDNMETEILDEANPRRAAIGELKLGVQVLLDKRKEDLETETDALMACFELEETERLPQTTPVSFEQINNEELPTANNAQENPQEDLQKDLQEDANLLDDGDQRNVRAQDNAAPGPAPLAKDQNELWTERDPLSRCTRMEKLQQPVRINGDQVSELERRKDLKTREDEWQEMAERPKKVYGDRREGTHRTYFNFDLFYLVFYLILLVLRSLMRLYLVKPS